MLGSTLKTIAEEGRIEKKKPGVDTGFQTMV
jgi:hypothetical protein